MSVDYIRDLVNIPSPSGFTQDIIKYLSKQLMNNGYAVQVTNKGSLLVTMSDKPQFVVASHIDTLGGMISWIRSDGTLELTQIGGWPPNNFEGEYLTIQTESGKSFRGTFLLDNPAVHANQEISKTERKMQGMHVRIDAQTQSREETENLGISIGDYIFFDPRFEVTDTGFIKSRFMDDKACAGILLDILLNHKEEIKTIPAGFFFSNYEEVGHGAPAGLPNTMKELLIADMGVIGDKINGKESAVSICVKDSSGPYDLEIRRELVALAREKMILHTLDVFPYYSSDGSMALRAGLDIRVGLIGPGVSASHGVERTHVKGVLATKTLILAWLKNKKQ
jgi:putative aminopeptidase FrvX